jgi:integrase
MATFIRRGDRVRVQIRERGHSLSRTFPDRATARAWAADVERRLAAGASAVGAAHATTLAALIDRYLDDLPRRRLADERNLRQRIGWWRDAYGGVTLADLTPRLIAEARDKLAVGRSPATTNRYLAALGAVMKAGQRRFHVVDTNPLRAVEREREDDTIGRALTTDEQKALLAACGDDAELRTAILFALTTGCRRGELERLRWPDVDFARQVVRFLRTKNGHPRSVHLPAVTVAALLEHGRVRALDDDRVFRSSGDWLLRRLYGAAERAQVGALRWHDLRHSAAHALARSGATLPELAAILGHRSLVMVARYAHLCDVAPASASDRAAAALG